MCHIFIAFISFHAHHYSVFCSSFTIPYNDPCVSNFRSKDFLFFYIHNLLGVVVQVFDYYIVDVTDLILVSLCVNLIIHFLLFLSNWILILDKNVLNLI